MTTITILSPLDMTTITILSPLHMNTITILSPLYRAVIKHSMRNISYCMQQFLAVTQPSIAL